MCVTVDCAVTMHSSDTNFVTILKWKLSSIISTTKMSSHLLSVFFFLRVFLFLVIVYVLLM